MSVARGLFDRREADAVLGGILLLRICESREAKQAN
jgi:hypothetical protein